VQFEHANSNQTAVVFKQPNAEARAIYKGHLCSDMTDAYSSNSQRKLVRTSNGKYHTVYIENMPTDWGTYSRLWYTCSASTNFNGGWNADIELPGTQNYPDIKNPSIDYYENTVAVVYEAADLDPAFEEAKII
jgi:hypothetical protein